MIRFNYDMTTIRSIMAAVILPLLPVSGSFAGQNDNLYSPAKFIRELAMPGSGNHFLRPGRILVDRNFNEIFVADSGNNRIIIFDRDGIYNFEFPVDEYCGAPSDISIDSQGRIYLLGSTSRGKRIFVFDYDGLYLDEFELMTPGNLDHLNIEAIAFDDDLLYALDNSSPRIIVFDTGGNYIREFPILTEISEDEKSEISLISIVIDDDEIFIPVPMLGTVYRYDLKGNLLCLIGHQGTTMAELNFPVSVSVTDDNMVLVLDKHRFLVVCFTRDGRFLGEFGGKGMNPGWFYHPSWMDVDINNRVYIGQIFGNKIQICDLPEFIKERNISLVADDQFNK